MDPNPQSPHLELGEIDASVGALAIIQRGRIDKLRNHSNTEDDQQNLDTVLVKDLLNGAWYVISRFDKRVQLLMARRDLLVVAEVDSETDFIEVADKLVKQISN